MYKQLKENPQAEICACMKDQWLRVPGELIEDDRREMVPLSRKNHKMIDGKLLQMDKKYSHLKLKQKEKFAGSEIPAGFFIHFLNGSHIGIDDIAVNSHFEEINTLFRVLESSIF